MKFFAQGNAEQGFNPEPGTAGGSQAAKELVSHTDMKFRKEGKEGRRENIHWLLLQTVRAMLTKVWHNQI